jgi:hypothetical protein
MAATFDLSFGAVPFCIPTPEIQAWIDRYIPLEDLREVQVIPHSPGPRLSGLGVPYRPSNPKVKLGRLFYPTGSARWAVFHGLATTSQVKQMQVLAWPPGSQVVPLTFHMQSDVSPFEDNQAIGGVCTGMYLLSCRPLSSMGSFQSGSTLDDLWLVTLVDERYYWQFQSVGSLTIAALSSWHSLISLFATALDITITNLTPSSVYGVPAEDSALFSNYEPANRMLEAVAWNFGCLVVRNFDGTYTLQTPADAQTEAQGNRSVGINLAGGDPYLTSPGGSSQRQAVLPESVIVTFPKFVVNKSYYDPRDSRDFNRFSYGSVWTETVTLAQAGYSTDAGFPGSKLIHDTARAYYPATPPVDPPTNETELQALAVQLASDYYASQVGGLDEVYPGIRNFAPEGLDDMIFDMSLHGAMTRVQRKPFNYQASEAQHQFTDSPGPDPGSLTVENVNIQPGHPSVIVKPVSLIELDDLTLSLTNDAGNPLIAARRTLFQRPGFSGARIHNGTDGWNVSPGAATPITFLPHIGVDYDLDPLGVNYNASAGTLTAPYTGYYLITASVAFQATGSSTSGQDFGMSLALVGVTTNPVTVTVNSSFGYSPAGYLSDVLKLTVGTVISLQVAASTGAGTWNANNAQLSMTYLGSDLPQSFGSAPLV